MTKNLKNIDGARKCLTSLRDQIAAERKVDPRFTKTLARAENLLRILATLQERYELIHSRKVPAKVQAKKAGAAPKKAKKAAKKTTAKKASNVVELHPKKAAAATAARRGMVKRSK